jgi:outer membrane protein assembly factor BamB
MRYRALTIFTILTVIGFSSWSQGATPPDTWNQWRGPARDGVISGFVSPEKWPKTLTRGWSVEVGEGHASPVIGGDRVFCFSRQDDKEVVRALWLSDGHEFWSKNYPAAYEMSPYASGHGKGPRATPAVAEGRLVTFGVSGVLSAWDTATGDLLWQNDYSKDYPHKSPTFYGTANSPLLQSGMLVAFIGTHHRGALVSFDPSSGRPRWQWDAEGPAYASAILANVRGTPQIITQSDKHCLGLSAKDGKLLWSVPLETEYDQNSVTPVVWGNAVLVSGLGKGTTAYLLKNDADKWTPEQVWHNADVSLYMSSPIIYGNYLFAMANRKKGQFVALDRDGKEQWQSEGRMGENAAILRAGMDVLAMSTTGILHVFRPGTKGFDEIAQYQVSDTAVWAHPAVKGNQILIRDRSRLTLWTIAAP